MDYTACWSENYPTRCAPLPRSSCVCSCGCPTRTCILKGHNLYPGRTTSILTGLFDRNLISGDTQTLLEHQVMLRRKMLRRKTRQGAEQTETPVGGAIEVAAGEEVAA